MRPAQLQRSLEDKPLSSRQRNQRQGGRFNGFLTAFYGGMHLLQNILQYGGLAADEKDEAEPRGTYIQAPLGEQTT